MTYDEVTAYLLSLPGATLSLQWGDDRIFKVGGKMFAGMGAKPNDPAARIGISFKADEVSFEVLTKKRGITPAAYLARAKWAALGRLERLPEKQLKAYLTRAHGIVAQGLPKKLQKTLGLAA